MLMRTDKYTFTKFVIPASKRGKTKGELSGFFAQSQTPDNQIVAVKRDGESPASKLHLARLSTIPDSAVFTGTVASSRKNRRFSGGSTPIMIPLFQRR
ncbi:MAG: hypothetical protein AAF549_05145 [Pseudomonadota bacterium]